MKSLQKAFDRQLKEILRPEVIGTQLIRKKLKDIGIELNQSQLTKIESQFANFKGDIFYFEIEDDQVTKTGFESENQFREVLSSLLGDLVSDLEKYMNDFLESLPSMIEEITTKISERLLKAVKRDAHRMLKDKGSERALFESNLYSVWGTAFDLLEMFIALCLEAGESFNKEFRTLASKSNDYIFEVLTRLHARACQIASEILTLLKAGYADGAHARWRSLHEISVVAFFIKAHGKDVAEKYLLHDGIESYKAATIYQEHCEKLGYEPLTKEEYSEMRELYIGLIERFGKSYKNEYGWAAEAIGNDRPTFKDIEQVAGLKHLRPYYKMASHNVHANPRGIFFKLGLYPESGDILLAGPSNVGLTDPGHSTALSLGQITVTLLTHSPNLDRLVVCSILVKLEDEIGKAFLAAEKALSKKRKSRKVTRFGVSP